MPRFVNTLLLVLLVFLGLTGVWMLYGAWQSWIFDLHRWLGFSLVVILPWKSIIIYRSLRRGFKKTFDRSFVILASLALAGLVGLVIVFGLLWLAQVGPYSLLYQTLIAWHWIVGLLLIPLFLFHLWRRWPAPKTADVLSRRSFLKLLAVAGSGFLIEKASSQWAYGQAVIEAPRRFTGSRAAGIFSGNAFPLTGEAAPNFDLNHYHLGVIGAVQSPLSLSYDDLIQYRTQSTTETLDCTSGWYTTQHWQGIPLIDLVVRAGANEVAGVRLVSISGYQHSYPIQEARRILLATHVGGDVLSIDHGYPLRAVVPGRRGWFWVKWLEQIHVLDDPLEVIRGILASPAEVLRQW